MLINTALIEANTQNTFITSPMIANQSVDTRRLKAILLSDVVGYSELMGKDEEATRAAIKRHMHELQTLADSYHGEVVEIIGDEIFLMFDSVVDAVKFAVDAQKCVAKVNNDLPDLPNIQFRTGVNLGDVIVDGNRYYGDSINITSRIEALAEPDGICITNTVYEQIKNKLRYGYECMGLQELKNISDPIEVFRVRSEAAGVDMVPSRRVITNAIDIHRTLPARPSVAVLPFTNIGGNLDEEYFSDGITEDITTSLSRFHGLFVIARGSAFAYKGKEIHHRKIGEELGVRYVVEGSIRRAGDKIRVSTQLIQSHDGHTVWAERYDRSLDDIFAVQDEITETIVAATATQIETAERDRMQQSTPADLEAYGFVLKGQQHISRYTHGDNLAARQMYESALSVDPLYARALAAQSRTLNIDWRYSWTDSPETILDKALELARHAVSLDEGDARAHAELGFVHLYRKENDKSIIAYERATKLNPNDADILSDMADALAHARRSQEAIELLKKAMRLNPFYPDQYLWHLGGAYFNIKEYDNAVSSILRMNNPTEGSRLLAASYGHLGQTNEAQLYANKVLEAHPEFSLQQWGEVQPDKYPEDTEHFIEGLKKAGL